MRSTRAAALLLVAASLTACGPADEAAEPPAASEVVTRPAEVPSASLEVAGRRTRLARGSACLRRGDGATVCGDVVGLPCPSPHLPELRVAPGAGVRIVLDRPPSRLTVTLGAGAPEFLPARSPTPWRPPDDGAGLLVVSAEVAEGQIDFRGCLVRQR